MKRIVTPGVEAIERRKIVSSTPTPAHVAVVDEKLLNNWSPKQNSGHLEIQGIVKISYEATR